MALRCWLFGHNCGAYFESDVTEYEHEKTAKCVRCGHYLTCTMEADE